MASMRYSQGTIVPVPLQSIVRQLPDGPLQRAQVLACESCGIFAPRGTRLTLIPPDVRVLST